MHMHIHATIPVEGRCVCQRTSSDFNQQFFFYIVYMAGHTNADGDEEEVW